MLSILIPPCHLHRDSSRVICTDGIIHEWISYAPLIKCVNAFAESSRVLSPERQRVSRYGTRAGDFAPLSNESTNRWDSPSTITIFSRWPVCRSYTSPIHPRRSPSSWKAAEWNAAGVRSFVTYDALMKFADPRVTVSRSCPDERRSSSWRQIMEYCAITVRSVRLLCEVTSWLSRGTILIIAYPRTETMKHWLISKEPIA